MSRENIEVVRSIQPPPELDLTLMFRRDGDQTEIERWAAWLGERVTDDFACVFHGLSTGERSGVTGLRDTWLDWLEPWQSYRTLIEQLIDVDDRVLVIVRDYGLRHGTDAEVEMQGAALYTLRDGKVARAEYFAQRTDAFAAAGVDPLS